MLSYELLDAIRTKHGPSFYLFYPERFIDNLNRFSSLVASHYPKSKLAYALKANYMPALCDLLYHHGYWAEVVSGMEYNIARLYLPGGQLIFNGPCKSREEMRSAIDEGALVNIDSFYELDLLQTLASEWREVSVGLRVNFDIGTGPSRFGFNFENGAFGEAVHRLQKLSNVRLAGIHSHFTTRERSLDLFNRRVNGMIDVYDSLPEKKGIEYLNLGGGFYGPLSDAAKGRLSTRPPTFDEYAALIGDRCYLRFGESGPLLILEPGVSMVADTMEYVVQILDVKIGDKIRYLTVDGSINCLYPTGSRYVPDFSVIARQKVESQICTVVGYTCMEHDILMNEIEIAAAPGDFIVFHNRGAYSNVYKPPFIREAPAIVGMDGTVYASRQNFRQILEPYSVIKE